MKEKLPKCPECDRELEKNSGGYGDWEKPSADWYCDYGLMHFVCIGEPNHGTYIFYDSEVS